MSSSFRLARPGGTPWSKVWRRTMVSETGSSRVFIPVYLWSTSSDAERTDGRDNERMVSLHARGEMDDR